MARWILTAPAFRSDGERLPEPCGSVLRALASGGAITVVALALALACPAGASAGVVVVGGNPAPAVEGIDTHAGGAGTRVNIYGSHLEEVRAVDFSTVPAKWIAEYEPLWLQAEAPAGSGTVPITVTTAGGTSEVSFNDYFEYPAPSEAPLVAPMMPPGPPPAPIPATVPAVPTVARVKDAERHPRHDHDKRHKCHAQKAKRRAC